MPGVYCGGIAISGDFAQAGMDVAVMQRLSRGRKYLADSISDLVERSLRGERRKRDLVAAEERFRKAISLGPALIDGFYGLGLVLKAQGRGDEAVEIFVKLVDLLEKDSTLDSIRRTMLQRLTKGQINLLKFGDWGLEKEIWKHGKSEAKRS